jgi:hypothetical protein
MAAELAEACTAALPRPAPARAAPLPVVEAPELEPGEPENQEAPGGSRRRLWLVAGGVLAAGAVTAVLAAVLGGGVGHESAQPSASSSEPSALAPAQPGMAARTQGVSRSVGAAAALPLAAPPLSDVVAFSSGTGVRYRSSPAQWCGDAPPTDPCWNSVVPGAGAAEGQQLRVYCYVHGAAVHGNSWWAQVSEQPEEYVPATFLQDSHDQLPTDAPLC